MLDSEKILVELGFSEVPPETRHALQRFFLSSAMRRADHPWEFWNRFSRVRGGHPRLARRLWNQFWRAFSMLYFFWLITLGRRGATPATPEQLVAELGSFQQQLAAEEAFLGGENPDTVDLQLFGIVQMCASIPGLAYDVLREHPELERMREWIEAMQARFSRYDRLYTGPDFEPRLPRIASAPVSERFAYWSGALVMWLVLPITLPIALYYSLQVTRKGLRGAYQRSSMLKVRPAWASSRASRGSPMAEAGVWKPPGAESSSSARQAALSPSILAVEP
jgi:hypothetical protein